MVLLFIAVNVDLILETRNAYTFVMKWQPAGGPAGVPTCPVSFSPGSLVPFSGCEDAPEVYPLADLQTICPYCDFAAQKCSTRRCETAGCEAAGKCLNPYFYEPVVYGVRPNELHHARLAVLSSSVFKLSYTETLHGDAR